MENRILIGKVTEEERDEIRLIYERQNGLKELFLVVSTENNELYNKVVADMGTTSTKFQNWWDEKSKKYNWEAKNDSRWEINFNTCDIFLVKK